MNLFAQLLQREFWEHRGAFFITPVVIGGLQMLMLVIALVSIGVFTTKINGADVMLSNSLRQFADSSEHMRALILNNGLATVAWPFLMVLGIVLVFYMVGSLYDDRKDRSILFWKSLPISDSDTVLSKLGTTLIVVPLIYLALIAVTQMFAMILASLVAVWIEGVPVWASLWRPTAFAHLWGDLLLGMFFTSLWWSPLYAWLMLCSAFSKRSPWLLAFAVPVGVGFLEGWLNFLGMIDTNGGTIGKWLLQHVANGMTMKGITVGGKGLMDTSQGAIMKMFDHYADPDQFASGDLWLGVAVAVVLITASIYARRYRSEV